MKIALCFIINYDHILNKEHIWREWIDYNKDIINVYFFYNDIKKIKSQWILKHTIPPNYIVDTNYYHIIPAYLSIMNFAFTHDTQNTWFCMLTDACCPIISPKYFRYLFCNYNEFSFLSWKNAWWNPHYHQRANLAKLPKELWLANDPWFTLTRENIKQIFHFVSNKQEITKIVCNGQIANESLFAIIFKLYKELDDSPKNTHIICSESHISDWKRMSSTTSPHLFKDANEDDIKFLKQEKPFSVMFIRKISPQFPDEILKYYIYNHNKERDDKLVVKEPLIITFNKYIKLFKSNLPLLLGLFIFYFFWINFT